MEEIKLVADAVPNINSTTENDPPGKNFTLGEELAVQAGVNC